MDKSDEREYSVYIIQHSPHSNYSASIQRDLVMDTAENLTQIGTWALASFAKDRTRIELFLKLTRKNLNALSGFPLSSAFDPGYQKFSRSFTRLEHQYRAGIGDPKVWGHGMLTWGITLTKSVTLI